MIQQYAATWDGFLEITNRQMVDDAVRQLLRYARTAEGVSGSPVALAKLVEVAKHSNAVGWVFGFPASANRMEEVQQYKLSNKDLSTVVQRTAIEAGLYHGETRFQP